MMRFPALNLFAQILPGPGQFSIDHFAARDKRGLAVLDVNHIGFFLMDLDLPRLIAVAALNEEIGGGDESSAFLESHGDLVMTDEGDRIGNGGGKQKGAHQHKESGGGIFHSVYLIAARSSPPPSFPHPH